MKINILLTGLVAGCLLFTGCEGFLDTAPYDSIGTGNMWTSVELAEKGVNGIYRVFYNGNLEVSKHQSEGFTGINRPAIEGFGYTTGWFSGITALTKPAPSAGDAVYSYEWKFGYTGIHRCNDALANLHKAGYTPENLDKRMCEVRFLRAFFYHRMNMLFKGVPIYTEPIDASEAFKPASTQEQVWALCLEDLKACIESPNFPANNLTGAEYGRPSKGAAYALRGMIYMWQKNYADAAKDFEKVKECGFDLWKGKWDELFLASNEKNCEMIFPLQFDEESGYCDNIQVMVGSRDQYDCWSEQMPATDWVDDFQNADGSEFKWTDHFPDWNKLTVAQREVFFCRNGLAPDSKTSYLKTHYKNVVTNVSQAVMDKYYLVDGNEERIKKAYENRDPRLQMTVYTPYTSVDCYTPTQNNGEEMKGKVFRYPFANRGKDGGDLWHDKRKTATWFYLYKKYNESKKGVLINRFRCYRDLPLIRYTDIYLQYAEALNETERGGEAKNIINEIRARAGMPPLPASVSSKEEIKKAIIYESRCELPLEGVNYFHELRWGTWVESKLYAEEGSDPGLKGMWGNVFTKWYKEGKDGADAWITRWPVPLAEQQRNSNLEQTPGWLY